MDQRIDQGLAQRLVHGGIVPALTLPQLEWHFQISSEPLIHLTEEVIHIARPTAIGHEAINPALLGPGLGAFLKIHHVMWQRIADDLGAAKHQQTGQAQTRVALVTILAPGADALQKFGQR